MSLTYLLTHWVDKSRTPGDFNCKESEAGEERESGVHGVLDIPSPVMQARADQISDMWA
jgi:hypothetical protein